MSAEPVAPTAEPCETRTEFKSAVAPVQPLRPEDDVAPLPQIAGGFQTVMADPPWRFQNRTGKVAPEHRRLDRYSTMTLENICDLDVDSVTANNAHLYLWVPNALLPEGLKVMENWGFRYVSNVIWAKRRKDGGPDGRGVGFYFRNVTEILLFGVKGSMRTLPPARSQVNMIETRKREHSRKPDEQYDFIERCSPGPYLELFARYPRANWTVWGNEASEKVQPRGKVYKGYQGGVIESNVAWLYQQENKSIREISDETGLSIRKVNQSLDDAGVEKRRPGRPKARVS
ncbi:MT-A70 family methyltransferase [Nesterenkonia alkaliphila]|uniref:DNA methyltransferase n=1 Tax=Nesterenkonia alkaliphila TaxID=1463631 RepID=A0A7K1UET5_9MICC|nr:MT-A70 family methyltransferase [Nesterenkonia alkaliphila]MVT24959.1 DNA methyltransferase [Nesterenkonia alkaliphila]GFZ86942.1 hypothetical protein GCM10011359_15110 [Nesterenkonia alkaliphila]